MWECPFNQEKKKRESKKKKLTRTAKRLFSTLITWDSWSFLILLSPRFWVNLHTYDITKVKSKILFLNSTHLNSRLYDNLKMLHCLVIDKADEHILTKWHTSDLTLPFIRKILSTVTYNLLHCQVNIVLGLWYIHPVFEYSRVFSYYILNWTFFLSPSCNFFAYLKYVRFIYHCIFHNQID